MHTDIFGLGENSGATVGGEYIPRHFCISWRRIMKELSVFIDESGDFGEFSVTAPYYIISFVFHNQASDIEQKIKRLDDSLSDAGLKDEYIHTHPIIRKEPPYDVLSLDERRRILNKMLRFTMSCEISYYNIVINKKEANTKMKLSAKIAKLINHLKF